MPEWEKAVVEAMARAAEIAIRPLRNPQYFEFNADYIAQAAWTAAKTALEAEGVSLVPMKALSEVLADIELSEEAFDDDD